MYNWLSVYKRVPRRLDNTYSVPVLLADKRGLYYIAYYRYDSNLWYTARINEIVIMPYMWSYLPVVNITYPTIDE